MGEVQSDNEDSCTVAESAEARLTNHVILNVEILEVFQDFFKQLIL
jgi:hypothetical protein